MADEPSAKSPDSPLGDVGCGGKPGQKGGDAGTRIIGFFRGSVAWVYNRRRLVSLANRHAPLSRAQLKLGY